MAPTPFTAPMECLPVTKLPDGPQWVYELKLDGYRAQAIRERSGVRLLSRNGKDLTKRFPGVVTALGEAIASGTVVDGELVALGDNGKPSFNALQNADTRTPVVFYAFDILRHDGEDVKAEPLRDRLHILDSAFIPSDYAQLCAHFPGPAAAFAEVVRRMGGEGVIAKRLDRRYEPGKRSGAWVKMRLNLGQEFVIGGYTPGIHKHCKRVAYAYFPQGYPHKYPMPKMAIHLSLIFPLSTFSENTDVRGVSNSARAHSPAAWFSKYPA